MADMSRAANVLQQSARSIELEAQLFRGFADPSRLSILHAIRRRPLPVGEIVAATGLSQPNVSNHLKCLAECGLVLSEQDGRFVYYRVSDQRVQRLLALAGELLNGPARAIAKCERYK